VTGVDSDGAGFENNVKAGDALTSLNDRSLPLELKDSDFASLLHDLPRPFLLGFKRPKMKTLFDSDAFASSVVREKSTKPALVRLPSSEDLAVQQVADLERRQQQKQQAVQKKTEASWGGVEQKQQPRNPEGCPEGGGGTLGGGGTAAEFAKGDLVSFPMRSKYTTATVQGVVSAVDSLQRTLEIVAANGFTLSAVPMKHVSKQTNLASAATHEKTGTHEASLLAGGKGGSNDGGEARFKLYEASDGFRGSFDEVVKHEGESGGRRWQQPARRQLSSHTKEPVDYAESADGNSVTTDDEYPQASGAAKASPFTRQNGSGAPSPPSPQVRNVARAAPNPAAAAAAFNPFASPQPKARVAPAAALPSSSSSSSQWQTFPAFDFSEECTLDADTASHCGSDPGSDLGSDVSSEWSVSAPTWPSTSSSSGAPPSGGSNKNGHPSHHQQRPESRRMLNDPFMPRPPPPPPPLMQQSFAPTATSQGGVNPFDAFSDAFAPPPPPPVTAAATAAMRATPSWNKNSAASPAFGLQGLSVSTRTNAPAAAAAALPLSARPKLTSPRAKAPANPFSPRALSSGGGGSASPRSAAAAAARAPPSPGKALLMRALSGDADAYFNVFDAVATSGDRGASALMAPTIKRLPSFGEAVPAAPVSSGRAPSSGPPSFDPFGV